MEFRVSISEKTLFVLLIVVSVVSAIGITLAQTPNPGHPWTEIECVGCIQTSNIGNNQVTSAKAGFNYAGSTSKGGAASDLACTDCVSDSEISGIDWSTITSGMPAGFADGTDADTVVSCSGWSGWSFSACISSCGSGTYCISGGIDSYCGGGRVTQSRFCPCIACQRDTCFTAGSKVLMADGSLKNIENLVIGDRVQGQTGINTVIDLARELMFPTERQKLISINGGDFFISNNHPVMTTEGWKALETGIFAESYALDLIYGKVKKLEVGDIILGPDGKKTVVESIKIKPDDYTYKLFVPALDGDHTFYVNNMLALSFVPDSRGIFTMENEREHDGKAPYKLDIDMSRISKIDGVDISQIDASLFDYRDFIIE
jgi:hypothetical protein